MPKYIIEYERRERRAFIVMADNPQAALNAWDNAGSDDVNDDFVQHISNEFVSLHHDEDA